MERDLEYSDSRGQTGNFNSHAHVERDKSLQRKNQQRKNFNSHAHVERDFNDGGYTTFTPEFQLTRSRGA